MVALASGSCGDADAALADWTGPGFDAQQAVERGGGGAYTYMLDRAQAREDTEAERNKPT